MNRDFTPSEHFEAEEKMQQHEKGREEANFYRHFLDSFHDLVVKTLLLECDESELQTTSKKLREIAGLGEDKIQEYLEIAITETNARVDKPVKGVDVNAKVLADMTPTEFVEYIGNLKSSLIK